MSQSRKHRGYKTQRIIAEYLLPLFPHCHAVGAGEGGKDLLMTPGYSIEVKARTRLDIPGGLRQAEEHAEPGDIPLLIARLNGQGEKAVGRYAVIMTLESLTNLIERGIDERQNQGQHEKTGTDDSQSDRGAGDGSTPDTSGSGDWCI